MSEERRKKKSIEVVAAVIIKESMVLATQRGYGDYKDWWEFPGGKIEKGEASEDALVREIREELNAEIKVGSELCKVEYEYPKFHMLMHCFLCELVSDEIELLEHESAKWLSRENLDSVKWLPSDIEVIELLKSLLRD